MNKRTKTGSWYVAEVVERLETSDSDQRDVNRRCLTWVNTLLIRADSLAHAYDKAMSAAKKMYTGHFKGVSEHTIRCKAVGLATLTPIYQRLRDGSEIAWTSKGRLSVKRSNAMVVSKHDLLKVDKKVAQLTTRRSVSKRRK